MKFSPAVHVVISFKDFSIFSSGYHLNLLCNFGRGHYGGRLCEIISQPVVLGQMKFQIEMVFSH